MHTGLAGKQGFIGVRGAGSAGRSGEAGRAEQVDMGDSCVGTMMALAAAAHLTPKYELLARLGPAGLLFDKLDGDLKNPAAAAVSAAGAAPPKSFATIHPPDILGSAELWYDTRHPATLGRANHRGRLPCPRSIPFILGWP